MKLAFSTNAFSRYSLSDALRQIREVGYEAVEILADVPHAYPGTLDGGQMWEIAREIERLGLSVSNVNVNTSFGYWRHAPPEAYFEPSLISPNPRHREDRTRMVLVAMDLAKAVGSRNISITSGRTLGEMSPDKAAGQLGEALKPILERAEKLGLDVGIECEPGLYIEWASELRELIDRVGHPRLGANLDIGHSQVMGESIPESVRLLRGRIWNMHIEDIPGRKHYHMIPGEGTLDWAGLKKAVVEVGYDRYLTVELYTQPHRPREAAEKSLAFLRRYF